MIPTRTSRPFGRTSPRVSDTDLARLIDRTIQMRVDAKREQGFAATNTGCDGRKRTTMFDGSACQTDGEVCIATRQDGISACIEAPTQGLGLNVASVTFSAPVCTPVAGWYVLDSDGYLYRITTDLQTAVAYWPPEPLWFASDYDLTRAGKWATLMCAAPLTPPTLHGNGVSAWSAAPAGGEIYYTAQGYSAPIGGLLTHLETVPSVAGGTNLATIGALTGRWGGVYASKGTSTTVALTQSPKLGPDLEAGEEYQALIYASAAGSVATVTAVKGDKALIGASVTPAIPSPAYIPLAVATVAYGGTVTAVSVGTTTAVNIASLRSIGAASYAAKWRSKGIILRDSENPNAGMRYATVTLPSAGSGVATGSARVAFGYPMALEILFEHVGEGAPFSNPAAGRSAWDMAFVYPPCLAVEYGQYHLNLGGADISAPDDTVMLSSVAYGVAAADAGANVIALPNGEVALMRPFTPGGTPTDGLTYDRFRIRPAPTTAPSVAFSQDALGTFEDDPNVWVAPIDHGVNLWTAGDTSFTIAAGSWTHGRTVPCVLWQRRSGTVDHYTQDLTAKYGLVGEPVAGVVPVAFTGGGGAQTPIPAATQMLTTVGPRLAISYGWTFTYLDPVTGDRTESALSPLSQGTLCVEVPTSSTATYTVTVTVPLGPDDTYRRTIYRFAYDYDDGIVGTVNVSPWDSRTEEAGAVYDRMCSLVGTIEDNVTTEYVDEETALSFSGVRPPSPFIAAGTLVMTAPARVYALPPLNL